MELVRSSWLFSAVTLALLLQLPCSKAQSSINISSPLEGRAGEDITITCMVNSEALVSGVNIIYRNRTRYEGASVSRNPAANQATFTLQDVTANLNGTDLACAFSEITSNYTPILLRSIPRFTDGSTTSSYDIIIQEGMSRTIYINVTGYPCPMAEVWRGGQMVQSPITATTEVITISNVNRVDTGLYIVNISNSEGQAIADVNLTVQYPPTFSSVISNDIICDSSSTTVTCSAMVGSNGTLMCDYDALPPATLVIDRPQESRARTDVLAATITISRAQVEDEGVYICTATSSVYTEVRIINLQVGTLPSELINASTRVNVNNITISWIYERSGSALPLTKFNIIIKNLNTMEILYNNTASGEETSLVVLRSALPAQGQFVVSVNPENIFGEGIGRDSTFAFSPITPPPTTTAGSQKTSTVSGLLLLVPSISTFMYTFLHVH